MRDITTIEEQMKALRTFEFADGSRITLDDRMVRTYGALRAVQMACPDWQPDHSPIPVYQSGRMIGTLSQLWDHTTARNTMMYQPRPGDFRREGDRWIADPMLGPGDLLHAGVNMIDKPEW